MTEEELKNIKDELLLDKINSRLSKFGIFVPVYIEPISPNKKSFSIKYRTLYIGNIRIRKRRNKISGWKLTFINDLIREINTYEYIKENSF